MANDEEFRHRIEFNALSKASQLKIGTKFGASMAVKGLIFMIVCELGRPPLCKENYEGMAPLSRGLAIAIEKPKFPRRICDFIKTPLHFDSRLNHRIRFRRLR
jgi:hypothetical protein